MNKRELYKLQKESYERLEREENERYQAKLARQGKEQERRMDLRYLTLIGEKSPGLDCETIAEALVSALRFARAYRLDAPVQVGVTSLLDLERRLFYEAHRTRLGWLVYSDGTLSERALPEDLEPKSFDAVWVPLEGAKLPISSEQLNAAIAEVKEREHEKS